MGKNTTEAMCPLQCIISRGTCLCHILGSHLVKMVYHKVERVFHPIVLVLFKFTVYSQGAEKSMSCYIFIFNPHLRSIFIDFERERMGDREKDLLPPTHTLTCHLSVYMTPLQSTGPLGQGGCCVLKGSCDNIYKNVRHLSHVCAIMNNRKWQNEDFPFPPETKFPP